MGARKSSAPRENARRQRQAKESATPAAPKRTRAPRAPRTPRASQTKDLPAVVSCPNLLDLQALTPEAARLHVDRYLHEVMPAEEAGDFEALSYRWELHLVPIDQLCLLRTVDLARGKLRSYRAVIRRGGSFPPLIGLGGDGKYVAENVLLCDGYHRVTAMRDLGIHFAWVWLATGLWKETDSSPVSALACCGA